MIPFASLAPGLGVVLGGLGLLLEGPTALAAAPRPNVLFIVVDDLSCTLGVYGHPQAKTPHIDRLAARGLVFERAYCQYPVCNPSRSSFLTGLRPDATHILDNATQFRKALPKAVTLPQFFRKNGYFTAGLGKVLHRGGGKAEASAGNDDPASWDQSVLFQATQAGRNGDGRNLTGGRVPWCRWQAAEGSDDDQPDGQIAKEAIRLMEAHGEGSFFLALGFHKPHDPFIAPKQYFDLYPLESLRLPADPPGRSNDLPLAIASPWLAEFAKFTDRERREFLRAYLAGVSFTDAQVGRVMAALDRLGLADRTVVCFLGDNGYHLGERGWWNKNTLFELSCRVPLVVVAPGRAVPGRRTVAPVELVDLFPTLAELCRLKPPPGLQGRSLGPLLERLDTPWPHGAVTQVQRGAVAGYALRTARWRYIEWDGGAGGVELYDEQNDPGEFLNRAGDSGLHAVRETHARQLHEILAAAQHPER